MENERNKNDTIYLTLLISTDFYVIQFNYREILQITIIS